MPVIKVCYDIECVESFNYAKDIALYEILDDVTLRSYLEEESKEQKKVLRMSALDQLVNKDLLINMLIVYA